MKFHRVNRCIVAKIDDISKNKWSTSIHAVTHTYIRTHIQPPHYISLSPFPTKSWRTPFQDIYIYMHIWNKPHECGRLDLFSNNMRTLLYSCERTKYERKWHLKSPFVVYDIFDDNFCSGDRHETIIATVAQWSNPEGYGWICLVPKNNKANCLYNTEHTLSILWSIVRSRTHIYAEMKYYIMGGIVV